MNGPFVVAQASTAEATAPNMPIRIVKVTKPSDGQATAVELGYEQQSKLDLTGVANEKMTFVHIGEKLIILFDNNATVTVEPFFELDGRAPAGPQRGLARSRSVERANSPPCFRSPRISRCYGRRYVPRPARTSATRPSTR